MQPVIVAEQTLQGVADYLATTFPATTPGFESLLARFLDTPGSLAKGAYITMGLPFRRSAAPPAFDWLTGFVPRAHQARAFTRLAADAAASTLIATCGGSGSTECWRPLTATLRRRLSNPTP